MTTPSPDVVASITELHRQLRGALPWLRTLSTKVAQVHGAKQPELRDLDEVVARLAIEVDSHLQIEEALLMPALQGGTADLRDITAQVEDHHELRGLLDELRVSADHFRAPAWACLTYRRFMSELQSFEAELLRCIHLENHAAAELEAR